MWSANLAQTSDLEDGELPRFTYLEGGLRNYSKDRLSSFPGIPKSEEIKPSKELTEGHFFQALLNKAEALTAKEIELVISDPRINLTIKGYETGAVPASANPTTSYASHIWTRDSAYVAFALLRSGHVEEAKSVVNALAHFYGSEEQRERLLAFHFSEKASEKYRAGERLPMIRTPIDSDGKLVKDLKDKEGKVVSNGEYWGHAQLDAIGEWLWTTFRFANQGRLDLKSLNQEIAEKTNKWDKVESVFIVATRFLYHVKCWQQEDLGPWEEKHALKRASSLGAIKAGLLEMKAFFKEQGWDALSIAPKSDNTPATAEFRSLFETLLSNVDQALDQRIPVSGERDAIETDTQGVAQKDAALSLLLYPYEVQLTEIQEHKVLKSTYELMGEVGIPRYLADEYVGEDYIYEKDFLKSKVSSPQYREAQWCIFDPILAGYYFRRYEESGGADKEAYRYGQAHLKRSIAQITSAPDSYKLECDGSTIEIPAGTAPEAYFYDSKVGRWRPNSNSPLNWTKAVLSLMLSRAHSAAQMWEAKS